MIDLSTGQTKNCKTNNATSGEKSSGAFKELGSTRDANCMIGSVIS